MSPAADRLKDQDLVAVFERRVQRLPFAVVEAEDMHAEPAVLVAQMQAKRGNAPVRVFQRFAQRPAFHAQPAGADRLVKHTRQNQRRARHAISPPR